VQAILDDYLAAPIRDELRQTLAFLRKVTLNPDEVGPDDVPDGVSRAKLVDALYVCAYFNLIDRVADSLGFDLPPADVHHAYAEQFLLEGYGNEV
jgi:hypothetical protein